MADNEEARGRDAGVAEGGLDTGQESDVLLDREAADEA